jgi:hypothetical protein
MSSTNNIYREILRAASWSTRPETAFVGDLRMIGATAHRAGLPLGPLGEGMRINLTPPLVKTPQIAEHPLRRGSFFLATSPCVRD